METIEYKTIDKSTWGDGPWQNEVDKRQWEDPATGLPCIIRRVEHHGAFCGYVGVPVTHPLFGKSCDDVELEAHGDVNFSDRCQPGDESESICHIPGEDESDEVWWFGFDCGHYMDFEPAVVARERARDDIPPALIRLRSEEIYRDEAYVTAEVQKLAAQLKALA